MPKETQPIHAGHRARMRIRFSETGLDGFRPHEVLEMLLFSVIPKRDVNPLAHALLDRFGTLDGVFSASCEELMETPGVGRQTAEFLKALDQTLDSYLASCHTSPHSIRSIAEALEYLPQSARTSLRFGVTVLFTDRHNRPVSVCSFPGRPDDPAVIREILDKSLSLHSHSAVVFCTGYRTVKPLSKINFSESSLENPPRIAVEKIISVGRCAVPSSPLSSGNAILRTCSMKYSAEALWRFT